MEDHAQQAYVLSAQVASIGCAPNAIIILLRNAGKYSIGLQAVVVEVAGDGVGSGGDGLEGLVAGGGAEVEKFVAGGEVEQRDNRLGARIHLGVVQKMGFRRDGTERFRDVEHLKLLH